MTMIHGLGAVNAGEVKEFSRPDPVYKDRKLVLEILRPEKHNPIHQIICYYYWDKKLEAKVEVTLYRNMLDGKLGSEVYYFKDTKDCQHYYSRNYPGFVKMPKKYYDIIKYIHKEFREIYG